MRDRETVEKLARLSRQALAGPLGYYERCEEQDALQMYEGELSRMDSARASALERMDTRLR
jgi:hypothetical protein